MSDEEVAAELGPDCDQPCSQLTYEDDIRNAKEQILARQKKESIHGILRIFVYINFILPDVCNIYFTASASAYDRNMQSLKKLCPGFDEEDIKPNVE